MTDKMTRFEQYVSDRVKELAAARRSRLEAALKAEEAKIEALKGKYFAMADDGVKALVQKIAERARKDGREVREGTEDVHDALSNYTKGRIERMLALDDADGYDHRLGRYRWAKGTPARKAQDALSEFDLLCERETRRIVVYKKDLGMKPEAFEAMLAETAKRLGDAQ